MRLGLCCVFKEAPIKFRTTTAAVVLRMERGAGREKLAEICRHNAQSLANALAFCAQHGIGSFRVPSQILPLKTHPVCGYSLEDLPAGPEIRDAFIACGALARSLEVRTVFHPDQFVVLSSPREDVLESSLQEIESQAEVAHWIGADVINIHAGGAYGDKPAALGRFMAALERLSPAARQRLTVENDDRTYTPADLLPCCRATGIPLVYDVHHHRCLPDGLSVEAVTEQALATWNREPLFHVSSPLEGWAGPAPHRHHDFLDVQDFPQVWRGLSITVEIEAKAKEVAIRRLQEDLAALGTPLLQARD